MDLTKEWYRSEFVQHESDKSHRAIEKEFSFYKSIAMGELEVIQENCDGQVFTNPEGMGRLSEDPVQNIRYHFVVTTALITRFCISYGMELEKAYGLSDFYILKMEKCPTIEAISALHDEMCLDFCRKMLQLKNNQVLSKPIVLCIDYIYKHLHYRITIKELADYLHLSESYLSRLFKKEMGLPVSAYILDVKIEKACNLLQYSDYSMIEIANYLAFASQSHFIQVFQKKMNMTPAKYRKTFFRSTWKNEEQP